MYNLISKIEAFFTDKLGRCGRCMQQSLALALAAWASFGIGLLMWPAGLAQNLIGIVAFSLTMLWILHVSIYAVRVLAKARSSDQKPASPDISRRHTLGVLLRAASVGAVASVPVFLWPSDAFAFCGQCTKNLDCGSANSGWVCRNTAAVNSGTVCNECVKS